MSATAAAAKTRRQSKQSTRTTTFTTMKKDSHADIPVLARYWLALYHRIPALPLPYYPQCSISVTLVTAAFLAAIKSFVFHIILVKHNDWPAESLTTDEAAACIPSIVHAVLLCAALIVAFQTQQYGPTDKLNVAPIWWQEFCDAILQFCTGYMIYDGLLNVVWARYVDGNYDFPPPFDLDDFLFGMHHILTAVYMTSARIIGAGHFSAMICMLLGEATNPLQNSFLFVEKQQLIFKGCCVTAHTILSVSFAIMYNIFRGILAPRYFAPVSYALLFTKEGRANIPLPLNLLWNFMIWAVLIGSIGWVIKCHGIYMAFFQSLIGTGDGAEEL